MKRRREKCGWEKWGVLRENWESWELTQLLEKKLAGEHLGFAGRGRVSFDPLSYSRGYS